MARSNNKKPFNPLAAAAIMAGMGAYVDNRHPEYAAQRAGRSRVNSSYQITGTTASRGVRSRRRRAAKMRAAGMTHIDGIGWV